MDSMRASHVALVVMNPPTNAGDIRDAVWTPGSGGCPGAGSGYLLLPGESHGQRSLVGYGPHGCKESDMSRPCEHQVKLFLLYR